MLDAEVRLLTRLMMHTHYKWVNRKLVSFVLTWERDSLEERRLTSLVRQGLVADNLRLTPAGYAALGTTMKAHAEQRMREQIDLLVRQAALSGLKRESDEYLIRVAEEALTRIEALA